MTDAEREGFDRKEKLTKDAQKVHMLSHLDSNSSSLLYPMNSHETTDNTERRFESRTPRLSRGSDQNKLVVYRKDLSEPNDKDITMVIFPTEKSEDGNGRDSQRRISRTKDIVVLPSADSPKVAPMKAKVVETKKSSKRLSLFSGGKATEKKSFGKGKKGGGGLSRLSLPNLPDAVGAEETSDTSPLSPKATSSFFKKKSNKTRSIHNTGWKFQTTDNIGKVHSAQSELCLTAIGETSEYISSSAVTVRTISMNDLTAPHGSITSVSPSPSVPDSISCTGNVILLSSEPLHSATDTVSNDILNENYCNGTTVLLKPKTLDIEKAHPKASDQFLTNGKENVQSGKSDRSSERSDKSSSSPKEFNRFTSSRKPLRKPSFTGKERPVIKNVKGQVVGGSETSKISNSASLNSFEEGTDDNKTTSEVIPEPPQEQEEKDQSSIQISKISSSQPSLLLKSPDSPRHRRIGISSISSPISIEAPGELDTSLPTTPTLISDLEEKKLTNHERPSHKSTVVISQPSQNNTKTVTTFVYQSSKGQPQKQPAPPKQVTQTFKYNSSGRSSLRKEKKVSSGLAATDNTNKVPLAVTSKKPPSGAKSTSSLRKSNNSSTSLSKQKTEPENKSSLSKPNKEKNKQSISTSSITLSDSVPTSSSPETVSSPNVPLSPPLVMESMLARPISPTSPIMSPDHKELPPAPSPKPNDEQSDLTYIYRSTLLRKSSKVNDSPTKMKRTSSGGKPTTSPRHESKPKPIDRVNSPRKSSLPVTNTLRSSHRNSLVRPDQRRFSSGASRTLDKSTRKSSHSRSSSNLGNTQSKVEASKEPKKSLTKTTPDASKPTETKEKSQVTINFASVKSTNRLSKRSISRQLDSIIPVDKDKPSFQKPPSGISRPVQVTKSSVVSVDNKPRSSMRRLSRLSSAGTISKGSTNRGTLKRGSQSSSTGSVTTHSQLTRGLSAERDDTLTAFDAISSMAQKNLLSSVADHKRAVRPVTRQKPSSSHLQILNQRKDVSSSLEQPAVGNSDVGTHKVDPNTYSTYMGKKVLDHTALAGLAAKLDFTTVKLKKTGIVEQMMADKQNTKNQISEVGNNYGVQFTSHPVMLLMIKGRKHIQTRLVQPLATSVNSGDIFILVTKADLFLFQGKKANIIEKARGNDVVNRICQKKELGCTSKTFTLVNDGEVLIEKEKLFWDALQGKKCINNEGSAPDDDLYEKRVILATKIYQYSQEGDSPGKFTLINDDPSSMPKISILNSKKILLFDFYSEVYVWIGKRSVTSQRKPAVVKARKIFDGSCLAPSFAPVAPTGSPARKVSVTSSTRASGRFQTKQRHGSINASTRRKSSRTLERKSSKGDLASRPEWALFACINEGSEHILFREKFSDWPEPGRIIKMKGHESSGEIVKPPPMPELQPVDVSTMLKSRIKFEGLRLDGENIHRGVGNYKVSRSTFACNRARTQNVKVYTIKEHDGVLLSDESIGILYSAEGYVIRWAYIITIVKELEGLTPGQGMFARDRKYQKEKAGKSGEVLGSSANGAKSINNDDSSDDDLDKLDDDSRKVLESGGRDCCAYFFWQGLHASVNEKGATAVMTIQLDKEKGPQIRVVQWKEHPAFLQLFNGSMIILYGGSENNELCDSSKGYRLYYCGGLFKKEAHLVEINTEDKPLSYFLRSRGCYVLQHASTQTVNVWMGNLTSSEYRGVARYSAKKLLKRLGSYKLRLVTEDDKVSDLLPLIGDSVLYHPFSVATSYTIRLFHLSSASGWFVAEELSHVSGPDTQDGFDPFPFVQEDIYDAVQPALFLLDACSVIYLWMGWWPEQKNKLLQEKNAFAGTASSRWARDKKLSLQTALNYAKECKRSPVPAVYVVFAGSEHLEFTNMFPIWNENQDVKSIVSKNGGTTTPDRVLAENELKKYTRSSYTIEELRQKPPEVNPNMLESYLSDADFESLFKMTKQDFSQLLSWKQVNLKKSLGLF